MAGVLMVPAIWNYFVGYAVGTAIAVIGLYIAFVIPVYLRWRKGDSWDEPRAHGRSGGHYKWIDPSRLLWVALITILFSSRSTPSGSRGTNRSTGTSRTTRSSGSPAFGIVFGGWWALSAKNWFKGPVRMGTEEELERLEEERLGEFALPTEAPSALRWSRCEGRREAPLVVHPSSAATNAGAAAVRSSRAKCSAA